MKRNDNAILYSPVREKSNPLRKEKRIFRKSPPKSAIVLPAAPCPAIRYFRKNVFLTFWGLTLSFEMLYCSMDLGATMEFELKMNGNTVDFLEKPMDCVVNPPFPELPFVSRDACANIVSASKAKQSKAKQSKAKQSKAKQCSATREHGKDRFRLTSSLPVISPQSPRILPPRITPE